MYVWVFTDKWILKPPGQLYRQLHPRSGCGRKLSGQQEGELALPQKPLPGVGETADGLKENASLYFCMIKLSQHVGGVNMAEKLPLPQDYQKQGVKLI